MSQTMGMDLPQVRQLARSLESGAVYRVLSRDQSVTLTPGALSGTMRGLDEIREHYGLE